MQCIRNKGDNVSMAEMGCSTKADCSQCVKNVRQNFRRDPVDFQRIKNFAHDTW